MTFSTNKLEPGKARLFTLSLLRTASVLAIGLLVAGPALAQSPATPSAPATENKTATTAKDAKLPFTLRVTNDQIIGISLKAKDVPLKQIASELARRLKMPVFVTPIMEKHLVTTNFSDLVIEPAMQMLAPQVYIDYEVDSTPGNQPRPIGIYLQGYNERPPAENAVVRASSDVIIIEGNTEDNGTVSKDENDEELKVHYEKGNLTLKAKKEPLVVVLYGIANELGIPFEVKREVTDLVTVNIVNSSVESALQQLGPNIRFYVRADLLIQERRPLRMVLVGPEKKS